jgi:hypothetical protein
MYDMLIEVLVRSGAVKATKFISPREIVRVVRTKYRSSGKFGGGNLELTVTRGKPNYTEREFIKQCQKSGEPFPVKKVLLKFLPKKRKIPTRKKK